MSTQLDRTDRGQARVAREARSRLLSDLPVEERRLRLAAVETAVLEGGKEDGQPIVLLHGPGEFAAKWFRVIPALAGEHRVIAPDLPGHGSSAVPEGSLGVEETLAWLGELIDRTCPSPPVVVGHVLGGAVAARFASARRRPLAGLVLIDSLGLARFRPSVRFLLSMIAYQARPTKRSYERFMRQCSYDLDALQEEVGDVWETFESYQLSLMRVRGTKAVGQLMRRVGIPRIPPEDLRRIQVPVTLIWGRYDRALRLRIAEAASERYGWPLHVIEDCADDPPRDRPEAFLEAFRSALDRSVGGAADPGTDRSVRAG